jgi:hypothetical protein
MGAIPISPQTLNTLLGCLHFVFIKAMAQEIVSLIFTEAKEKMLMSVKTSVVLIGVLGELSK